MAIANGTCVSFCNQPKAHYLATSRESRRSVVAFSRFAGAGIWLRKESLRHILAYPGYVSRVKCYTDGKRIQCRWSNASQHAHLRSFTSYSDIFVGSCNFFLPLAFNAPVGVSPLEFQEKVWTSEN